MRQSLRLGAAFKCFFGNSSFKAWSRKKWVVFRSHASGEENYVIDIIKVFCVLFVESCSTGKKFGSCFCPKILKNKFFNTVHILYIRGCWIWNRRKQESNTNYDLWPTWATTRKCIMHGIMITFTCTATTQSEHENIFQCQLSTKDASHFTVYFLWLWKSFTIHSRPSCQKSFCDLYATQCLYVCVHIKYITYFLHSLTEPLRKPFLYQFFVGSWFLKILWGVGTVYVQPFIYCIIYV